MKALGVLNVDSLDVAVKLLLGTLLVVTPPRDADAEPVADTLHTLLPDLLVQLGVQTDIGGALYPIIVSVLVTLMCASCPGERRLWGCSRRLGSLAGWVSVIKHTMACVANALISLIARGALFLKVTPWSFPYNQYFVLFLDRGF